VRVLAFSDLHRDLDGGRRLARRAADADLVIGAGDFASFHRGLQETIAAISTIETPTLLVPGNHETEEALRSACGGWRAATVLHGSGTQIDGVAFFGLGAAVPLTPWEWSVDLSEEEAENMLAPCPDGAVLVLHSPPKGHLDDGLGSEAILRTIERKHPPLAVCGHIHQCWGQESQVGDTRVVNLGPAGALLEI
jgi:Icc-related predicted phosphoesterase